jgi:hypothetical protein
MKIITLCGSTKFKNKFEEITEKETLKGNIVLSVGVFGHISDLNLTLETKSDLDKLHFKKIDISSEILVINPGGYIGLSTCNEIHYALLNDKIISFLEKPDKWYKLKYVCGCKCNPRYGHSPSCIHDNWDRETKLDFE